MQIPIDVTLNFCATFSLKETKCLLNSSAYTHCSVCRCSAAETSYIHSLTLSSCFGKCFMNLRGCRNPPSPRGAQSLQPNPPKLESWGFFSRVWRRVCYSCVARECFSPSVISGVGRGASSRPHRWHSCPCSTHNTEPLVAWQSTHISTTFISHSAPYFCLVSPLAPN